MERHTGACVWCCACGGVCGGVVVGRGVLRFKKGVCSKRVSGSVVFKKGFWKCGDQKGCLEVWLSKRFRVVHVLFARRSCK